MNHEPSTAADGGPSPDGGGSLLERLSQGDPTVHDEICRRYGERVSRIARRLLGSKLRSRLETADVTQGALMEILQGAPDGDFDSEAAFLGWVHRVVERQILDASRFWQARCRNVDVEVPLRAEHDSIDAGAERPSQVFARSEQADRLSDAIARLPDGERGLVISRLMLSLPWNTIADREGLSEDVARKRYSRTKARLRDLLRDSELS
ncbi:MAG: sigma-70 family RNA polymerase sigma factor [Planctomycetota bacterium]